MIKEIVHRALRHRHFWREVGVNELIELYISNMLHTFAISIMMVFVPFYMYQNGYSVPAIFSLFGCFFVGRVACDVLVAHVVARVGPKHTLIMNCILQIIVAAMLLSVPEFHWKVWQIGPIWGASASFFFIALHVAFSKVKHTDHSGKEIGFMQIMDKIGGVIGPLVGGLAGSFIGSQWIFIIASVVLFASLWPLFRSSEPVQIHQRLRYSDLPLNKIKRDLFSYTALGVENTLCVNTWPLYISLFVLSGSVYLQLGVLSSAAVLVSMASAYAIGRHSDAGNGRRMLRAGAVINALVYVWRPFTGGIGAVFATNVVNEVVTTAYRLPYIKGMYSAADDLPGFRIVYLSSMEMIASVVKGTVWFLLALLATILAIKTVLIISFGVAAVASLAILTEQFKALSPKVYNAK